MPVPVTSEEIYRKSVVYQKALDIGSLSTNNHLYMIRLWISVTLAPLLVPCALFEAVAALACGFFLTFRGTLQKENQERKQFIKEKCFYRFQGGIAAALRSSAIFCAGVIRLTFLVGYHFFKFI